MSIDVHAHWGEVKANSGKLATCPRHRFGGTFKIGERKTCEHCGGTMTLAGIGDYIRGYEASGKPADDIWPGFRCAKA